MRGILGQSQLEMSDDQSRSRLSVMSGSKIVVMLSMGLTAAGLLVAVPAFGQTAANPVNFNAEVSKTLELTPVTRTALFNPELDSLLSSSLLWISYLSLPLIVIGVIWRHDRRAREKMAILLQQMATLERIFQHPQAR